MGSYTNTQKQGHDPILALAYGSPVEAAKDSGLGTFSPTEPSHAAISDEDHYEHATILTEVINWPFSEDEAGIPFDQANLYGVRTRAWSILNDVENDPPLADGDRDWWTAVPKTLPAGYTATGRCGQLVPLVYDYLGDNPLYGEDEFLTPLLWQLRTPTGVIPYDADPDEQQAIAEWRPLNLNQLTLQTFVAPLISGFYLFEGSVPPISDNGHPPYSAPNTSTIRYWYAVHLGNHIGVRGCRIRVFVWADDYVIPIIGGTEPPEFAIKVDIKLGWSDEPPSSPDFSDNEEWTHTFTEADLVDEGAGNGFQHQFVGEIISDGVLPPHGRKKSIEAFVGYQGAGDIGLVSVVIDWGPRTDVPLWYFASTGNLTAPGGYVTAP